MIETWRAAGPATLRFLPGTRESEDVAGEFEDPASIELEIPVIVTIVDEVEGATTQPTALKIVLEEIWIDSPSDVIELNGASEDSTIYLLDRHRVVMVTSIGFSRANDGWVVALSCAVEVPGGTQTLALVGHCAP